MQPRWQSFVEAAAMIVVGSVFVVLTQAILYPHFGRFFVGVSLIDPPVV